MQDPSSVWDVPGSRACATAAPGTGWPAQIVIFRHCDEGFAASCPPKASYAGCRGCEFLDDQSCATNSCGPQGAARAYGYGRWLACFAAQTAPVAAVFAQTFQSGVSNRRPMTTASMLYDSLLKQGVSAASLCWEQFPRPPKSAQAYAATMGAAFRRPGYAGKTVAVVWDHGGVQFILGALGINIGGWWWDGCCYDQAVVVRISPSGQKTLTNYKLATFPGADPCASACQAAVASPYGCSGRAPGPGTGAGQDMYRTGRCVPCATGLQPYLIRLKGASSASYNCFASPAAAAAAGQILGQQSPANCGTHESFVRRAPPCDCGIPREPYVMLYEPYVTHRLPGCTPGEEEEADFEPYVTHRLPGCTPGEEEEADFEPYVTHRLPGCTPGEEEEAVFEPYVTHRLPGCTPGEEEEADFEPYVTHRLPGCTPGEEEEADFEPYASRRMSRGAPRGAPPRVRGWCGTQAANNPSTGARTKMRGRSASSYDPFSDLPSVHIPLGPTDGFD